MKRSDHSISWFSRLSPHTHRLLGAVGILFLGYASPAIAGFPPGEGGAIPNLPELQEPGNSITSLWVSQTDRENYHFIAGNEPTLDLKFDSPARYGASGFDLQKSPDGVTDWETLYSTFSADQDNFSFNPGGLFHFRLLVRGGLRDGQISNVVFGAISSVPTQFSGWGGGSSWLPGAPMAPWIGHGLTAYFNVRNLSDSSPVTDAISLQWYRRDPQTGEMLAIPGATQDTYTTTADDLGGYQLFCRGNGDGINAGGYAQIMAAESVVIFNRAEATNVSRGGFTLNLYKSVSSLTASDLKLSYWDDSGEVEIPVTAVNAHVGNAIFDLVADVPDTVSDAILSNRSNVWKIGTQFGEGDMSHQVRDLMITFPAVGGTTFAEWADASGLPEGQRGPLDRNGPLMVQNLLAYAMGLNPLTITKDDMPSIASPDLVIGTIHLIYRRAKNPGDATFTPMISTDLKSWSPANVITETILEEGEEDEGESERVDATLEFTSGPAVFLTLAAKQIP